MALARMSALADTDDKIDAGAVYRIADVLNQAPITQIEVPTSFISSRTDQYTISFNGYDPDGELRYFLVSTDNEQFLNVGIVSYYSFPIPHQARPFNQTYYVKTVDDSGLESQTQQLTITFENPQTRVPGDRPLVRGVGRVEETPSEWNNPLTGFFAFLYTVFFPKPAKNLNG